MNPGRGEPDPGAAGFVLAGGQSTRMGIDKALVELAGKPLVAHTVDVLRDAGLAGSIVGARSDLGAFAPVIPDVAVGLGPLSGICAALASPKFQECNAEYGVFLSVDLPLIPSSLIDYLLRHARITGRVVTLSSVNGFAQTFPVVLDRKALPALEAELRCGRGGCFRAFESASRSLGQALTVLPAEILAQSGQVVHRAALPPIRWFANLNAPADLLRAEALMVADAATKLRPSRIA